MLYGPYGSIGDKCTSITMIYRERDREGDSNGQVIERRCRNCYLSDVREGGRKGEREKGREGGRKRGREEEREGGREGAIVSCIIIIIIINNNNNNNNSSTRARGGF